MDPLGASVSPSAKPGGRIRCRQPGTRLAPVLYLADAQTLGLMEDGLAESTHSDWLCRRCQQPRGLPSQSGSWRRTQGGRAQGSPAPERSTRLPPGSGESGGQSRLGEGATPATPNSSPPKQLVLKSLVFFQESSTQSQPPPRCAVFSPCWRRWRRLLRPSQPLRGHHRQCQKKKEVVNMDITYKVGSQDREKGMGGSWGGRGQSITPDLQQDKEESHIRN